MRIAALTVMLLAGCSGLVPGTALLLERTDPLSADPRDISIALNLPAGIDVRPNSAKLALSVTRDGFDEAQGVWTLELSVKPEGRRVFRVADADHEELRSVQAKGRAWKAADPEATKGALSLALGGCRTEPGVALEDASASAYITLRENGPALPLFVDVPIVDVLSEAQISALPRCP